MVAAAYIEDPIAFWKKGSVDESGRDVLAAMINVMSSGYVRVGKAPGRNVCLALFRRDRPCQTHPLPGGRALPHRSSSLDVPMKKTGKYSYYRLGISPNGVWHYFIQ